MSPSTVRSKKKLQIWVASSSSSLPLHKYKIIQWHAAAHCVECVLVMRRLANWLTGWLTSLARERIVVRKCKRKHIFTYQFFIKIHVKKCNISTSNGISFFLFSFVPALMLLGAFSITSVFASGKISVYVLRTFDIFRSSRPVFHFVVYDDDDDDNDVGIHVRYNDVIELYAYVVFVFCVSCVSCAILCLHMMTAFRNICRNINK